MTFIQKEEVKYIIDDFSTNCYSYKYVRNIVSKSTCDEDHKIDTVQVKGNIIIPHSELIQKKNIELLPNMGHKYLSTPTTNKKLIGKTSVEVSKLGNKNIVCKISCAVVHYTSENLGDSPIV